MMIPTGHIQNDKYLTCWVYLGHDLSTSWKGPDFLLNGIIQMPDICHQPEHGFSNIFGDLFGRPDV